MIYDTVHLILISTFTRVLQEVWPGKLSNLFCRPSSAMVLGILYRPQWTTYPACASEHAIHRTGFSNWGCPDLSYTLPFRLQILWFSLSPVVWLGGPQRNLTKGNSQSDSHVWQPVQVLSITLCWVFGLVWIGATPVLQGAAALPNKPTPIPALTVGHCSLAYQDPTLMWFRGTKT